jgi:hypothetical protein
MNVEYLRLALVVVNSLAFLALLIMSLGLRRREKYVWIRRLWTIVALACGAVVLGSFQRIAIQAVSVGWLPETAAENVTSDLQLSQSLIVLALLVGAFATLKRLSDSMEASDRLSASLLDRVRHVDPTSLHLTNRENEVLALIGQGITTDCTEVAPCALALPSRYEVVWLGSSSGVQSHVTSLRLTPLVPQPRHKPQN